MDQSRKIGDDLRSDETIVKFLKALRSGLNYVQTAEVAGVSIYAGWQWPAEIFLIDIPESMQTRL